VARGARLSASSLISIVASRASLYDCAAMDPERREAAWATRRLWATVAVAVVAFVLGVVGYLEAGGVSFASAVYDTLLLFTLNFVPPNDQGTYPVALEIARFLAPLGTLLAAAGIAAHLFRDEFDRTTARWRARWRRDGKPVVVCGLGQVGTTIAQLLRARGHAVVAVELDRSCPAISTVRPLGVPVVVGDARIGRTLARAGVGRAALVVWSAGPVADGAEVEESLAAALRARRVGPFGRVRTAADRPPACQVRVRDLGLCELRRRDVLMASATSRVSADAGTGSGAPRPDVDYFNEWENTAQRLMWEMVRGYDRTPGAVDLWLAGGGPLAEALVVQAVRTWRALAQPRAPARLAIHVFDDHASEQRDRFAAAWPDAAASCDLCAHDGPPELVLAHGRARGSRAPEAAFVLVDGRDRALELGLRLREVAPRARIAVAVPDHLRQALGEKNLTVFDPVAYGLDRDILLLDTYALFARMNHERWLNTKNELSDDPRDPKRDWVDLDPLWIESNREAARFTFENLWLSGYQLAPPNPAAPAIECFPDDDLENMAAREHARWFAFLTKEGWKRDPNREERDLDTRTNPNLRVWSELTDEDKEYTRDSIRDYPRQLAQLGYHVWRTDDPDPPAPARS
jgi:TrkA-N domain/RyR domain